MPNPPLPRLTPVSPQPQPQNLPLPMVNLAGASISTLGAQRLGFQDMAGRTTATFQGFRQDMSALLLLAKLSHNAVGGVVPIGVRFNNDSTSPHYYSSELFSANAAPVYANTADQSKLEFALLTHGTSNAGFASSQLLIPGYSETTSEHETMTNGMFFQFLWQTGGIWNPSPAGPITRIDTIATPAACLTGSAIWLLGLP